MTQRSCIWSLLSVFWLAFTSGLATAKGLGPSFRSGDVPAILSENLVATWNPQQSNRLVSPGLKILFFGEAKACSAGGKDGAIAKPADDRWSIAAKGLTGVRPDTPVGRWTPSGATDGCDQAVQGMTGDSFAVASVDGGFGLYTESAGQSEGGKEFFAPFGDVGQNGKGANKGIEATFVAIRRDWRAKDAFRPWSTGTKSVLSISTRQGVASLRAEGKDVKTAIQTKQQATATFLNEACMREPRQSGRGCQVKYLFHTAIARAGVSDWDSVPWFNGADVILDPGQGGIPVLQGPLPNAGETVVDRKERVPMYVSKGAKTQHSPFRDLTFAVDISFEHFLNALRLSTAQREGQPIQRMSESGVSRLFGKQWEDPNEWVLLEYSVGQEVSNRDGRAKAFIGGNFLTFELSNR